VRSGSMSQAILSATDRSQKSPPSRPEILRSLGRILLGLILVFGAYSKLHFNGGWHFRDYYFFLAMAIRSYRTFPLGVAEWIARILPWLELTLGVLLIGGVGTRWVTLVTSALLVYMATLPRAAFLGLAGRMGPIAELLFDIGFFLLALNITLKSFQSHGARHPLT
jgi:uncharacterized membrane protein YphA (DoxX/SURF4 family)